MNALLGMGYIRGVASYFSANLFPCILARRQVDLPTIAESAERATSILRKLCNIFDEASTMDTVRNELERAYHAEVGLPTRLPTFSFVVRSVFTRSHLLNRCLISIDYIRRSLEVPVEVVIASDVATETAAQKIKELELLFPGFVFCLADGRLECGVSRVRNLKAGIKATTGGRVFIIDDDDYYLPHVCPLLGQVLDPEFDELLLLDAQIVNEKWIETEHKYQRELLSFGTVFKASDWRVTYGGTNSLPLCSIVYPGDFIRRAIVEYEFNYNLSEDFIFHLIIFSHPARPCVRVTDGVSVHQSHRPGADNVSTHADRSGWCLDTGNAIYDLLFRQGRQFEDLARIADGSLGRGASLEKDSAMQHLGSLVLSLLSAYEARSAESNMMEKKYGSILSLYRTVIWRAQQKFSRRRLKRKKKLVYQL